jgi:multisubunit Na+/H+ antiporter MnhB subunit
LFFYIFADGGIKNFYLSNFRHYKKESLFSGLIKKYINSILIFYFLLIPIIFFILFYRNEDLFLIALLVFFRTIFLIIINFNKIYYSVKQVQIKMFNITLLSSILTIVFLISMYYFNIKNNIFFFFFDPNSNCFDNIFFKYI